VWDHQKSVAVDVVDKIARVSRSDTRKLVAKAASFRCNSIEPSLPMPFVQESPQPLSNLYHYVSGINSTTARLNAFTILPTNSARIAWGVQSVGTGVVYVAANGDASSNNFAAALKPATALWGGDGGTFTIAGYTGPVAVSGGINAVVVGWENR